MTSVSFNLENEDVEMASKDVYNIVDMDGLDLSREETSVLDRSLQELQQANKKVIDYLKCLFRDRAYSHNLEDENIEACDDSIAETDLSREETSVLDRSLQELHQANKKVVDQMKRLLCDRAYSHKLVDEDIEVGSKIDSGIAETDCLDLSHQETSVLDKSLQELHQANEKVVDQMKCLLPNTAHSRSLISIGVDR